MAGSTMPLPTVEATFRWKTKIATKLNTAAKATAWWGLSTPVDTTVAMELAASCRPFMKSKASASATRNTSVPRPISRPLIGRDSRESRIGQDDALGEVRDVLAAVGDGLELLVDHLHLDDLAHVLLLAERARDRRAQLAVGLALEPVDLVAGLDDGVGVAVLGQQPH